LIFKYGCPKVHFNHWSTKTEPSQSGQLTITQEHLHIEDKTVADHARSMILILKGTNNKLWLFFFQWLVNYREIMQVKYTLT